MSKITRESTHGGKVIKGECIWQCVCGKQEITESEIDLPLNWVKMVIWRGTKEGTKIIDVIKCYNCQKETVNNLRLKHANTRSISQRR